LKLGFHYHIPAQLKDDKIYMPGYLGLFIDSISKHIDEVICFQHSPRLDELNFMDYEINSSNVRLVQLEEHTSIPRRYLSAYSYYKTFKNKSIDCDVILVRASTPLLPIIYAVSKKPILLYLVSNATKGVENLEQPFWRKFFIRIWANWYQKRENNIAKKTLTMVNSQLLFDELNSSVNNLKLIKSTTLSDRNFYYREDTCNSKKIKLLFSGRLSETKGIMDILESIAILKKEGVAVHLTLVGMVNKSSQILNKMKSFAEKEKISDSYCYEGYKSAGECLLDFYRKSDIFICVPQASSEGFPRTIWEALASSLPVIASRVSSIPNYINDCSVLVEPKKPKEIANAIKQIISEKENRKKMISIGFSKARENTLEKRSKEMIDTIKIYMRDRF